jgi:ATP-dependent Clp protease ATP-binding subunit ClpB
MMSIFDKGQLDMGNNQVTDFRNVIIVLAANLGLSEALKRPPGFGANHSATKTHAQLSEAALEAYEKRYSLPWRNRVDDVVVMEPFTSEQIDEIVQMELDKFKVRMASVLKSDQMFELSFDNLGRGFIFESAMKSEGKVAEIKRLTQRLIIDRLGPQIDKLAGNLVIVTHKPGARDLTFILIRKPNAGGGGWSGPGSGQSGSTSRSSTSRQVTTVRHGANPSASSTTERSIFDGASIAPLVLFATFGLFMQFAFFGGRREAG